jgi:CheY-like chemotaxis protein
MVCAQAGCAADTLDILVVEDDSNGREAMRMLLELHGHRVVVAENGIEAVEKGILHRPQVALIDLHIPRLGGLDAGHLLRTALGDRVLLLAQSAYDDLDNQARAREAGFDGFLAKPFSLGELTGWLDKAKSLRKNGPR